MIGMETLEFLVTRWCEGRKIRDGRTCFVRLADTEAR